MILAFCEGCELWCDGTEMEYVVELEGANGERVYVAPFNRALLDRRDMKVEAEDFGLVASEMTVSGASLLCVACSTERAPLLPLDS